MGRERESKRTERVGEGEWKDMSEVVSEGERMDVRKRERVERGREGKRMDVRETVCNKREGEKKGMGRGIEKGNGREGH